MTPDQRECLEGVASGRYGMLTEGSRIAIAAALADLDAATKDRDAYQAMYDSARADLDAATAALGPVARELSRPRSTYAHRAVQLTRVEADAVLAAAGGPAEMSPAVAKAMDKFRATLAEVKAREAAGEVEHDRPWEALAPPSVLRRRVTKGDSP